MKSATCKPDFVSVSRLAPQIADGHFSAANVAICVTAPFSENSSGQPESSSSRVCLTVSREDCAFCLALHRTGVASAAASPRRWCAFTLSSEEPHRFTSSVVSELWLVIRKISTNHNSLTTVVSFLWPYPDVRITARVVAVSDRPALWCPDFPHRFVRQNGATIQPRSSLQLYLATAPHRMTETVTDKKAAAFLCGKRCGFSSTRFRCRFIAQSKYRASSADKACW